ncbi:phage antirepressor KilAC domain-containing protein [Pseudomonas sp. FG1]|nr:phage antirepressor KilAC domain-containing protein [Pseudomonas sp. FG1]MDY7554252.1 phage antirepressor KilAC domain-containing protein [Pseudomonas sp. FG1]
MNMTATPGNTPSVATLFGNSEKVSRHTMSSREIADLVEARHNDVIATIERLFSKGLLRSDRKSRRESTGGRPIDVYDLTERDTHLVIAGYSDEHRARVIDRWQELESKVVGQLQIPTNFAEALQLAADQAKQNASLHQVIQQQAPKVQALERLSATDGSICITSAAKQLGIGPLKLFKWLSDNRWIYRRAAFSAWSAYQPRLTAGLLEHKLVKVGKGAEEDLKVVEQVMVTRKGITHLATVLQEAL